MYVNARAIIERETESGTELLLQVAERPGEAPTLEFPGGRLEEFESILAALNREVLEETGLQITQVLDDTDHTVSTLPGAQLEFLKPFCVYQTTTGPVDSIGFFFRCHATGTLTTAGDLAAGHRWLPIAEVAARWGEAPAEFHWLTAAVLGYYLQWRGAAAEHLR